MSFQKGYIVDTNIILNDSSNVEILAGGGENLVIIPDIVLDEIDAKKGGFDEINFQAREFARLLQDLKVIGTEKFGDINILSVQLQRGDDTLKIAIPSKESYGKGLSKSLNIDNDKKIIEMAKDLSQIYQFPVKIITLDIMMRTRAISLGIETETLRLDKKQIDEMEFVKDIEISEEQSITLNGADIFSLDPDYKPENFSYRFRMLNGRVILGVVQNRRVSVIDENELRKQTIKPKNVEQLFFSNALFDPFYDVIMVNARAGSGKTLLALSAGMNLVRKKEYSKIVYIRNSIESLDKGEEVGFLAGNAEKFIIYNHPLYDSLEYILRENSRRSNANRKGSNKDKGENIVISEERLEDVINHYGIETMWVGELRGRTIHNAFVIIDEAQNISDKTMKTILTRVADDCKVVVIGSLRQIDNVYLNKHTSSLTRLLSKLDRDFENINAYAIELNKVVRGKITEWAESEIFND